MTNNEKLNQIFSRVLDINIGDIKDIISPANTPSWDSFNTMLLVSEIENEFSIQFTMEEIFKVKCIRDMKLYIEEKGVENITSKL